jgi:type VI secretion system protein ImpL
MTNAAQQIDQQSMVLTMVVVSLVMTAIIGLIYGGYRLLSTHRPRRERGERSSGRSSGSSSPRERADRMPKNALVDVWRRFMRGQPRPHRKSIKDYPMVLVLGPAGSGKSQIIDSQVDWHAQQKRFLPSVTDDALLQVYIGSRVVVQEVSSALLADDSSDARRALRRLWSRSAGARPPGVVVVLDAVALGNANPEELRRQAHVVRGKIDLLQELHRRPMRVSVCLTHLDRFTGFAELADVATRHRMPLAADLRGLVEQRDSRGVQVFGASDDLISAALATSPSESFARIVELMASSGGLGPSLGAFLGPLGGKSRLSMPPDLDKLYFFAPGAGADRAIDRAIVAPAPKAQARKVKRRNVLRLAIVGAAASLYLGLVHYNHAKKLDAAVAGVAAYEASCKPGATAPNELDRSLERADLTLRDVQSAERWWPLLKLSSRADKRRMAAATVTCTRGAYFLPIAAHGAVESRELAVYLLGVLYAARDNLLGAWITPRAAAWATNLKVPERSVTAYIYWSEHAWGDPIALQLPLADNDPTLSLKPWIEFFVKLQAAYDSQDVSEELAPLQTRAGQLAEAIDRSHKYPDVSALLTLLPPVVPFDVSALLKAPKRDEAIQWIEQNRPPLEGVLAMVQDGELSPAVLGRMTLVALLAHVNKIMGGPSSEVYAFKLERKYAFGRQRWQEMIARASVQLYVRQPGYPFLPRDAPQAQQAPAPAVAVIDATQQGSGSDVAAKPPVIDATQLATALPAPAPVPQAVVDPYHRATVDGMVRPVFDEFGKKLPASPIPANDRATLAAYALDQSNAYAQKYRETLYASYQPYHLNVRNVAELPPAINAMIKPNGGFMKWLRGLAEDADLQNLDSPYLRSLSDAVAPLQPIVRLVHPKDATAAELSKYVTLVTKLSRELAGTERTTATSAPVNPAFTQAPTQQFGVPTAADPATGGGGGGGDDISRMLSPVARVAMGMLLQPDTSYTAQTLQWLAEVGITDDLRIPFLEPFERVLDFGVPELERGLQKQWTRTWGIVGKTFEKYPFRRKTKREVEPSEIDAFREGGAFWQSFRELAQFCVLRSTGWAQRGPLARPLNLPAGMLGRVNMIVSLARVYFDKDGKRQPLALTVTPLPLPKELDREGYVTMSFLRGGGAAVFGFNQAPIARAFSPSWWGADGSSIGIVFGDPVLRNQSDRAPDQQLDASASPWALYHLLEKAQQVGDTYIWTMPREFSLPRDGKRRVVQIRFVMRGADIALHPWTQFGKE